MSGLHFVELALSVGCLVCGIVTAVSVTITQGGLGGQCMLYGTVSYNATAHTVQAQLPGPVSLCSFVSGVSVAVAIVCFLLALYSLCSGCSGSRRERVCVYFTLCVCGLFLLFLLVSGCILHVGRDALCRDIVDTVDGITSCEQAQKLKWAAPFDGENFYTRLHNAETAVWVNLSLWAVMGVLLFVQKGAKK
ncbi:hypothetical protein NHX12_013635 [Muraenolepis orangiensis]|uniref:Transmembrane protein 179B n=1 Tax=Muraenolepis orangiensis TaxID=630683 RepID=A0A9Q0DDY8_9TELE|nr:hypothetical protein NHX12_013635 [Muraenolepis orangiensis]